jgi:small conductance mechanosensitive channel
MDWQAFLNNILNHLISWATDVGIKLLIALAVMLITFKCINFISTRIEKSGEKHRADKTIMRTVAHIFKIAMKLIVAVCLVSYVGIDTSGFAALIASLGVCIGLAVNGALSNLAGGVLLLVTRPFRVDDHIEACGYEGIVEDIRLTNTRIHTWDNKVVYIPNGTLSTSVIVNYSEKDIRRVDFSFEFSQKTDIPALKELLLAHISAHQYALASPAPVVRISGQADGKVSLQVCVWSKTEYYWDVYFDLHTSIHALFMEHDITLAAPKLDVNVTDPSKEN